MRGGLGEASFEWSFEVRSLDARLVVRAHQCVSSLRFERDKCLGSFALRLSTVRARLLADARTGEGEGDGGEGRLYWYSLRPRSKRREALQEEEQSAGPSHEGGEGSLVAYLGDARSAGSQWMEGGEEGEGEEEEEEGLEDQIESFSYAGGERPALGLDQAEGLPALGLSFRCHLADRVDPPSRQAARKRAPSMPLLPTLNPLSSLASHPPRERAEPQVSSALVVAPSAELPADPGWEMSCIVRLWGFDSVRRKGTWDKRPYVRYVVGVGPQTDGAGWTVNRRFKQFCDLHDEIAKQMPRVLESSGASLPSKVRLPSSLEAEGKERIPLLQRYLNQLMQVESLRCSQPLAYFVGASHDSTRLGTWQSAIAKIKDMQ
ncbi:MAG: hypothetical protein SGPRY_003425 [Prymnesium sp.]